MLSRPSSSPHFIRMPYPSAVLQGPLLCYFDRFLAVVQRSKRFWQGKRTVNPYSLLIWLRHSRELLRMPLEVTASRFFQIKK